MLLKKPLGSFQSRGDIGKSRCTIGINNNGINHTSSKFVTGTAGVIDTCGKFATCVNGIAGRQ
jgi:hypothetical protein